MKYQQPLLYTHLRIDWASGLSPVSKESMQGTRCEGAGDAESVTERHFAAAGSDGSDGSGTTAAAVAIRQRPDDGKNSALRTLSFEWCAVCSNSWHCCALVEATSWIWSALSWPGSQHSLVWTLTPSGREPPCANAIQEVWVHMSAHSCHVMKPWLWPLTALVFLRSGGDSVCDTNDWRILPAQIGVVFQGYLIPMQQRKPSASATLTGHQVLSTR